MVRSYEALHPGSILLFLIDNHYETYDIDRFPGLAALSENRCGSTASFPSDGILDVIGRLSSMGYNVKLVISRNEEGHRDIPDALRIMREREEDY